MAITVLTSVVTGFSSGGCVKLNVTLLGHKQPFLRGARSAYLVVIIQAVLHSLCKLHGLTVAAYIVVHQRAQHLHTWLRLQIPPLCVLLQV